MPPDMMPPGTTPRGGMPPPMMMQGPPFPPIPMMMMPPPQPPRGGGIRAFLMTMLVLGLLLSVGINIVLLVLSAGGSGGSGSALQLTISPGSQREKVAVIPLRGMIEANASYRFDHFMDMAEADGDVKAVVLEIDSPGGTVTASDEIYDRIRRFKQNKNVPVVVTMGSLATSGGYYTACGADYIFAQPTTMTGNIGVLMPRLNFSKLFEKYGVAETTIVSQGARFKNAGSSYAEETPEERKYLQDLIDTAFERFKKVVVDGRGAALKGNIDDIANGKVYIAKDAVRLGLIDEEGYAEDAYNYAAAQAGLSSPQIVRYEVPPTFLQRLLMSDSKSEAPVASGGGVTIHVDAKLLDELSTPRPLYLWRGQ